MQRFDVVKANWPNANILTKDDLVRWEQDLPLQQYDAFVLYADEDIEFAVELVDRMEKNDPRFGFRLCLNDRDIIGGLSIEREPICRLIAERCNRLVVIVSAAFIHSWANTFFMNFVQVLQIEQRNRKIVPILYENCVPPNHFSYLFMLKYNSAKMFKFWEQLSHSIRSTTPNQIANN